MRALALLVSLFVATGCATLMHGHEQEVGVATKPSGAKIYLDGVYVGKSPMIIHPERGDTHMVRLELDGYETVDVPMTRSASGWLWGNIVLGGLIGLAVDGISGGAWDLEPTAISPHLDKDDDREEQTASAAPDA